MSDKILSVGLDLGTATTQLVLSELTIENIASVFTIPRVYITDKKVLYKSKIIFTPISHQSLIEVDKIKDFVIQEYQKNKKNQCIRLQMTKNDDIIRIQVIDNGSGYNVETVGQEHLGLILVQRFVESKLSGRLVTTSNNEGTQVKIIFKV